MELYIWYSLGNLTENWHNGGGLVVVAESLEKAWQLNAACRDKQPDVTYRLIGEPEEIEYVFPDAGCC